MTVIFEFIIYVRGGNCYYSPQAPKNIAMPLVRCSCPRHEVYRKNKDMAPLILNFSTRMSCVASITPRSQSRYCGFWRRSGLLRLPGSKPHRPACSWSLQLLCYPGYIYDTYPYQIPHACLQCFITSWQSKGTILSAVALSFLIPKKRH
jgi:hypothetical protein